LDSSALKGLSALLSVLILVGDGVADALGRVGVGCCILADSTPLSGLEQLEKKSSMLHIKTINMVEFGLLAGDWRRRTKCQLRVCIHQAPEKKRMR